MNPVQAIMRKLRVLRAVAFVTYKEWSAYRTHSMISIFVGPVYFLVQYFIWSAVYGNAAAKASASASGVSIHGLSLRQMLVYFGANALIGYLTMDFADWNLQMLVRTGKFLTFALRPLHHRFFALSQKFGHRLLGLIFEFLPCALIFIFLFRIPLLPARPLWALSSIALSFLMVFYVNYSIGLTGFWLVKADGLRFVIQTLQAVLSGSLIPLVFFPGVVQKLLFFLPFQYMLYVPSMVCAGSYSLGGIAMPIPEIVGIQAVAVLAMAVISELLYRAAMRRFTGVGA
jgi:ABC-2 type transport system permease protein